MRFQSALSTTTRVSEVDITNICPSPESHVHSWVTFLFLPSTTTRDSKGNRPAGELLSNTSLTLDKSCANFLGCSLSSKMTAWTNPPRSKGPGLLYSHMGYRELYFSPGPRYAPHYCLLSDPSYHASAQTLSNVCVGLTWAWKETEQFMSIETTTSIRLYFSGTGKSVRRGLNALDAWKTTSNFQDSARSQRSERSDNVGGVGPEPPSLP